jgi:hypothetical protein
MSMDKVDASIRLVYRLIPEVQRPAAHRLAMRYAADISALRAAIRNGEETEPLLPRAQASCAALGSLIPPEQRPAGQLLMDDFAEAVRDYADAELAKPRPVEDAVK